MYVSECMRDGESNALTDLDTLLKAMLQDSAVLHFYILRKHLILLAFAMKKFRRAFLLSLFVQVISDLLESHVYFQLFISQLLFASYNHLFKQIRITR